jgi:hypothetical protein
VAPKELFHEYPLRAMNTSHKWHPPPGPEVHQLSSVLARNGLGQYADVLLKEDVSLDTIGLLTDQQLKELRIPLGPRAKLIKLFSAPGGGAATPVSLNYFEPGQQAHTLPDYQRVGGGAVTQAWQASNRSESSISAAGPKVRSTAPDEKAPRPVFPGAGKDRRGNMHRGQRVARAKEMWTSRGTNASAVSPATQRPKQSRRRRGEANRSNGNGDAAVLMSTGQDYRALSQNLGGLLDHVVEQDDHWAAVQSAEELCTSLLKARDAWSRIKSKPGAGHSVSGNASWLQQATGTHSGPFEELPGDPHESRSSRTGAWGVNAARGSLASSESSKGTISTGRDSSQEAQYQKAMCTGGSSFTQSRLQASRSVSTMPEASAGGWSTVQVGKGPRPVQLAVSQTGGKVHGGSGYEHTRQRLARTQEMRNSRGTNVNSVETEFQRYVSPAVQQAQQGPYHRGEARSDGGRAIPAASAGQAGQAARTQNYMKVH